MKHESFEFINQSYVNFNHNCYTLTIDEINFIISSFNVVHNKQLNQNWFNAIFFITIANILSINSQFFNTNKTFYM
ncbi:hypothetical protein GASC598B02_013420 [Gilliamella apicola SCGC AB-598-B02]|nr:hypothetical protein GASC598B02_013420 [Gilliamella apicola SCGC AB-598-B02]